MNRLKPCVLLLIFFLSCSENTENIIPKDQMVHILADVHVANSYAAEDSDLNAIKQRTSNYMNAIYDRYQIDSAQFNKSVKYYSKNPTVLSEIYDQVEKNLKTIEDSLLKLEEIENIRFNAELRRKNKQDSIFSLRKKYGGKDSVILKPVVDPVWVPFDGYHHFLPIDTVKTKRAL